MSSQSDITLKLKLTAEGIKEATNDSERLNQSLEKGQALASRAKSVSAGYKAAQTSSENIDSARAVAGTGGSGGARDFARESQGLGGLVRLYAVLAANIYAATSAAKALSDAMNTTNMVTGLNQLGASSGVALGSLAKQVNAATDGVLSLKEAMNATTKATVAGVSGKELLELTKIAVNASRVLGIDTGDALNRLVSGIEKQRPVLFESLGIYAKIVPSEEAYAKSLNKTVASLTQAEKSQALLNGVLAEGKRKYDDLNIDANPYQKLTATLANVTQSGLEFINKFLGPLATILAENTGLLTAIFSAIALKLVGSAIPALTNWRGELGKSAQAAKKHAQEINESFGEKFVERTSARLKIPELEKDLKAAEQKYAESRQRYLEINKNTNNKQSSVYKDFAAGTVTDETLAKADKEINANANKLTAEGAARAKSLNDAKTYYIEQQNLRKQHNAALDALEGQSQRFSVGDWARGMISQSAGSRADSLAIRNLVPENVEKGGFSYAMAEMRKQIAQSTDMGPWTKFGTGIRGVMSGVATEIGIFGRALQGALGWIGLIVTAVDLLVNAFAKAEDESKAFNNSISYLSESTKTAEAVYKKYKDTISTESLSAKSNVAKTFGEQIDTTIESLNKLEEKSGWADRLKDTLATALGGGIRNDFGKNIGAAIEAQLKLIPTGPLKDEAERQIKTILNIDGNITKEAIGKQFYWMQDADQLTSTATKLSDALKPAQAQARNLGTNAKELGSALSNANDASQKLLATLQNKDPLVAYGESLVKLGSAFSISGDNAETLVAAVNALKNKPDAIKLLNPEEYDRIIQFSESLPDIVKNIEQYSDKLKTLENSKLNLDRAIATPRPSAVTQSLIAERDKVVEQINSAKLVINLNEGALSEVKQKLSEIAQRTIKEGYNLVNSQLTYAIQQASISFSKSILSGVSGVGVSQANASLEIQSIEIQKKQISTVEKLNEIMIQSNIINSQRVAQESNAAIRRDAEKSGKPVSEEDKKVIDANEALIKNSDLLIKSIKTGKNLTMAEKLTLDPSSQATNLQIETQRLQKSVQITGLSEKEKEVAAQGRIGTEKELQDVKLKGLETDVKSAQLQETKYKLSIQSLPYLSDAQLIQQKALQDSLAEKQNNLETQKIQSEIAVNEKRILELKKDDPQVKTIRDVNDQLTKQIDIVGKRQKVEKDIANIQFEQLKIAEEYKKIAYTTSISRNAQDQGTTSEETDLQLRTERLNIENQLKKYTADEYAAKEKSIKLDTVELEAKKQILAAARRLQDELLKNDEEVRKARAADPNADVTALENARPAIMKYYDDQIDEINKVKKAKKDDIDLTYSMSERMKGMSDIVAGAFQNMGDAIEQFTHTGKLDFQGLINSMISDLVRFELRAQMSKFYNSFHGLSGIVGAVQNAVNPVELTPELMPGFNIANAKGAAYDYGVHAFAKGGTFSNSIVDSPTLFKFASGTGLMGEAGPEAIMPLKRDNQGNLGVQNHQNSSSNVEVTVNNYGSEKAQTKESTDSRGNRKIEVIIGEASASDINTNGSASQKAIGGTYGIRPQLIRR